MFRVLLVEPDDETCLWLWHAIMRVHGRITITDSVAAACDILRSGQDLRLLITDAALPDGRGSVVAQEAAMLGIPSFIVTNGEDGLRISDENGSDIGARGIDLAEFLEKFLSSNPFPHREWMEDGTRSAAIQIVDRGREVRGYIIDKATSEETNGKRHKAGGQLPPLRRHHAD